MSLFYLRSHKLIALASGCSALALFALRSTLLNVQHSFQQHRVAIGALKVENLDQFSRQVNAVYEGLKKANRFMNWYLSAQQKKVTTEKEIEPEYWGLQLLKEQLNAAKSLKDLLDSEKDLNQRSSSQTVGILSFFRSFEALCRRSKQLAIGIGALELAWIYTAYIQRAYLMAAAGVAHFAVQIFVIKELSTLQHGSGKIKKAEQVAIEFHNMARHSFLLSRLGLQQASVEQIQHIVVIPFDAILKLIPSWKTA